ncbi:hypothetical protein MJO28_008387 [Puccinia striiformis f. sp. tritici]|uniref:Uncharacterized protein n=3 Tax=Puccinia striiformis TaxID=27350 RepID=A0A0L0VJ83_9BASI|nr:hypothetical protein MJO28_008387 [Puccinia striiformis f. sp. tritici]KNE99034.1 hypothetical protein PSTG_07686 [Puccinia striiformis f. sp. tritici PST-78]POW00166.1 hypothetical protein PSHT_13209 [Puccinia striiformis]
MATRAEKAQRQRRRDERKDHKNQAEARTPLKKKEKTTKKKSKKPQVDSSTSKDSSDYSGILEVITVDGSVVEELNQEKQVASLSQFDVIEINGDNSEYDKISPSQELKFKENNQANNMMSFLHASINNGDTSDEDEMNEDEPLQALWSIFKKSAAAPTASPVRRQLKSGKFGYQKPVKNPNSSLQKLTPAIVSKQTQHDRKKVLAYKQGYSEPQAEVLMKIYKSHCCIPREAAMQIDTLIS